MLWIAPPERDTASVALEKRPWDAADQFRANSGLKSQEYSAPVLGLIFLRFAEVRFAAQRDKLEKAQTRARARIAIEDVLDQGLPDAYTPPLYQQKCAVLFEHVYETAASA